MKMGIITDPRCTEYHRAGHPERPARIEQSVAHLKKQKDFEVDWMKPVEPTQAQLLAAHESHLLSQLERSTEDFDGDTAAHPGIFGHAKRSVGGALKAMAEANAGRWAISLLRPPGHHATRHHAMGFCYLNSIAITAIDAATVNGNRVALFDFDVHHGNGTEDILVGRKDLAFVSVHQHPCYPGTGTENRGNNCYNFPVAPKTPRLEYRKILTRALESVKEFRPSMVGVSAGFDAYARDPLAQETLEAEDYYWLGEQLRLLGIPVWSVLEGGYSGDLPDLIHAYIKGLLSPKVR